MHVSHGWKSLNNALRLTDESYGSSFLSKPKALPPRIQVRVEKRDPSKHTTLDQQNLYYRVDDVGLLYVVTTIEEANYFVPNFLQQYNDYIQKPGGIVFAPKRTERGAGRWTEYDPITKEQSNHGHKESSSTWPVLVSDYDSKLDSKILDPFMKAIEREVHHMRAPTHISRLEKAMNEVVEISKMVRQSESSINLSKEIDDSTAIPPSLKKSLKAFMIVKQ